MSISLLFDRLHRVFDGLQMTAPPCIKNAVMQAMGERLVWQRLPFQFTKGQDILICPESKDENQQKTNPMRKVSLSLVSTIIFATLPLLPHAMAEGYSSQGILYYADHGIYEISQDGTKSTFASGSYSYCLTFDLSGNLYTGSYESGSGYSIYKFTPDGTRSTFATGLQQLNDLAFDLSGNLYAAAYNGSSYSVFKFSATGIQTTFVQGLSSIGDIEFDGSGNLFVASNNSIYKYNSAGAQSVFATGIYTDDIVFDAIGNLYTLGSSIFKFTPDGTKSTFASGFGGGYGMAFDPSGNLFVGQTGSITQITPDGTATTYSMDLQKPQAMEFAVPEPSIWGLLGAGCVGLALVSRQSKYHRRNATSR